MPTTVIVRSETQTDIPASGDIVRQAFGRSDAARLLEELRKTADFSQKLSLVAEIQGARVGYALFLGAGCSDGQQSYPAAHLFPLAVLPRHQRQGVGERLVRSGLEHCRAMGIHLVFTTSAPEFFSRLDFQPALPLNFDTDLTLTGRALQVLDLDGGLLGKARGRVTFSKPFYETLPE